MKKKLRPGRRIVQSGNDRQINHRADFIHCPSCNHEMDEKKWDAASVTLILAPSCYKAGCVTVMSECPKCFEASWVHNRMSGFEWNAAFPDGWKEAVKKREALVKLDALRKWGESICHNCRHLTSGTVEYHAWRHCIKGSGGAETKCVQYAAIKKN